jgi:hypothetical protein
VTEYADVPGPVLAKLSAICGRLPDASEEQAWTGRRWRIRKRTFAHVYSLDSTSGPFTAITFRSEGPELAVLRRSGHPFFAPRNGHDTVAMILDAATDWDEVAELVTESYCVMAPKKLAAQVDRPSD